MLKNQKFVFLKLYHLEIYIGYAFFFLFQLCFILQLYYLINIQKTFAVFKPVNNNLNVDLPLSVIICARNEANNLKKNLPLILQQSYENFEVIVVNDCSYDHSEDVLKEFCIKYPHLKVVKIEEHPRHKTGKKFAATMGIKASKNELLVFTDADCEPVSANWLKNMASHYHNSDTEIVLGYSPYVKQKGFLNKLIRYETYQTALNYFSFVLYNMPYMGVGRNMSYKKALFFKGKGFAAHMHIPSGDDDLFVNQNATATNTSIEINEASHMLSEPKLSWKSYYIQKMRHLGAGKLYKKAHKIHLTSQGLSAIGFYTFLIVLLLLKIEVIFVLSIYLLRFIAQLYIYYPSMIKLKSKELIWSFIILDPIYYLFLCLLNVAGLFKKKIIWK